MSAFLSKEWINEYAQEWNGNEKLRDGLKNFTATIKYSIEDIPQEPVYLKVENGEVTKTGIAPETKYDFEMWATSNNWKVIATGKMGPKAAMLTKKLKFKGSMVTAMKYMGAFEESLRMMGRIPTQW